MRHPPRRAAIRRRVGLLLELNVDSHAALLCRTPGGPPRARCSTACVLAPCLHASLRPGRTQPRSGPRLAHPEGSPPPRPTALRHDSTAGRHRRARSALDTCKRLDRHRYDDNVTSSGMPRTATSISCSMNDSVISLTGPLPRLYRRHGRGCARKRRDAQGRTRHRADWHRSQLTVRRRAVRGHARNQASGGSARLPNSEAASSDDPNSHVSNPPPSSRKESTGVWSAATAMVSARPSKDPHPHPRLRIRSSTRDGGCKTAGDTELLKVPRGRLSVRRCGHRAVDGMPPPARY
jgi:hypothetical protein